LKHIIKSFFYIKLNEAFVSIIHKTKTSIDNISSKFKGEIPKLYFMGLDFNYFLNLKLKFNIFI